MLDIFTRVGRMTAYGLRCSVFQGPTSSRSEESVERRAARTGAGASKTDVMILSWHTYSMTLLQFLGRSTPSQAALLSARRFTHTGLLPSAAEISLERQSIVALHRPREYGSRTPKRHFKNQSCFSFLWVCG